MSLIILLFLALPLGKQWVIEFFPISIVQGRLLDIALIVKRAFYWHVKLFLKQILQACQYDDLASKDNLRVQSCPSDGGILFKRSKFIDTRDSEGNQALKLR